MTNPFQKIRARASMLGQHPSTDWYFMLGSLAVALVVVAIVDCVLYVRLVSRESVQVDIALEAPLSLDRKAISDTASGIRQKERDAAAIPQAVKRDPSI